MQASRAQFDAALDPEAPLALLGGSGDCTATPSEAELEVMKSIDRYAEQNILFKQLHQAPDKFLQSGQFGFKQGSAGASHAASDEAYNEFGFCPLKSGWERLKAAKKVGGAVRATAQLFNEFNVWIWSDGEDRWINPATDDEILNKGPFGLTRFVPHWDDLRGAGLSLVLLPTLVLTDHNNRTSWFLQSAQAACWGSVPLANGPMIFKYPRVRASLTDPKQERGYYTATAPQHPDFFDPELPLFLDGARHQAIRRFWQFIGLARRYNVDVAIAKNIQAVPGCKPPSELDVAKQVIALVTPAVWGEAPPAAVLESTEEYAKYGKFSIFGEYIHRVLSPVGIAAKIKNARVAVSKWAQTSKFGKLLVKARDFKHPGSPWFASDARLVDDVATATLFAGIVGTTDLTKKCIEYQKRDARHQVLFKQHPERYLIELMRYDSAVTSVTELLRANETFNLEGRNLMLQSGSPAQLVLATANRDPTHWRQPATFDPSRPDLADTLSWNGRAADVEAQDLSLAPRGCPGYCLSLKVGAAVCAGVMGVFEELYEEGKVLAKDGAVECSTFGPIDVPAPWTPPPAGQQVPTQQA